jgi:hypothetical protein
MSNAGPYYAPFWPVKHLNMKYALIIPNYAPKTKAKLILKSPNMCLKHQNL